MKNTPSVLLLLCAACVLPGCASFKEAVQDVSLSYTTDAGGKSVTAVYSERKLGIHVDGRSVK